MIIIGKQCTGINGNGHYANNKYCGYIDIDKTIDKIEHKAIHSKAVGKNNLLSHIRLYISIQANGRNVLPECTNTIFPCLLHTN